MSTVFASFTTALTNWTVPEDLYGGVITVDLYGCTAGAGAGGIPGNHGGRLQVTIPVTPGQSLKFICGQLTGTDTFPGGVGGTGTGHEAGGHGGGGTAVMSGSTLLAIAGGGGGGAGGNPFGYLGTGGLGGQPGGDGVNGSDAAGGKGANGGTAGGNGTTTGHGGVGTASIGSGGAGGGGGGGYAGGGGGARSGDLTNDPGGGGGGGSSWYDASCTLISMGQDTLNRTGLIAISYEQTDEPLQPTLLAPANGTTQNFSAAFSLLLQYNPSLASGELAGIAATRVTASTGIQEWWDVTAGDWSDTEVVNVTGDPEIDFPDDAFDDDEQYSLSAACEGSTGKLGAYAPWLVIYSVDALTLTYTAPPATVDSPTPTVAYTPDLGTSGPQTSRHSMIYSVDPETTPGVIVGVTAPYYDLGVVNDDSTTFSVPSDAELLNGTDYWMATKITGTPSTTASLWTVTKFTTDFTGPGEPQSYTMVAGADPNTGMPIITLAAQAATADSYADISMEWRRVYVEDDVAFAFAFAPVRGCPVPYDVSGNAHVVDYEAPNGVEVFYQVRSLGKTEDGQTTWSDWVTPEWPVPALPASNWWAVNPLSVNGATALHRASATVSNLNGGGPTSIQIDEVTPKGVFATMGSNVYTVVRGTPMQPALELTATFLDSDEWERFHSQFRDKAILLKSDMEGALYWVELGSPISRKIAVASNRQANPLSQVTVYCYPVSRP